MKENKSVIDTYENLYGVDLVVANKYATLEELKELYVYSDGVELEEDLLTGISSVATCTDKRTDKSVVLVKYNHDSTVKGIDKKVDFINTCAHEAGHVALDIYLYANQEVKKDSQEPFCYLLGWAAECIYKTLKK